MSRDSDNERQQAIKDLGTKGREMTSIDVPRVKRTKGPSGLLGVSQAGLRSGYALKGMLRGRRFPETLFVSEPATLFPKKYA